MSVLDHTQLEEVWVLQGGLRSAQDTAAAIAQAESGGHTDSINNTAYPNRPGYHPPAPGNQKEYSVGLWQINMLAHPQYTEAELLTPLGNAKAAVAISGGGLHFSAWSTFTTTDPKRTYKRFLTGTVSTTPQPGTVFTPAAVGTTPQSFRGWLDANRALAIHLPTNLKKSDKLVRAAQATLAKAGVRR